MIRLDLAYDGTGFRGWAAQRGRVRTVQGVLQEALGRVLGEAPQLAVAGRTDAGVHASGQVASFEVSAGIDPARLQRAVNGILGPEVVVLAARIAPDGYPARHRATGRAYVYRMETGPIPSPFDARYVWHRPGTLSLSAMRLAARPLLGEHDFASFCRAPQGGGSTVRRLRRLSLVRHGTRLEVRAEANAFLHQMVRSIVGTLADAGEGRLDPARIPEVLAARDRAAAGRIAPPHGLTLVAVSYGRRRSREL